jgi:hypothetical protein
MNYAGLNDSIIEKVMEAVAIINNPEIDPEVRQLNQEILFREVGSAVYAKVFDMNAFDMEIQHITGPGIDDRYYGLAKVTSGSISTGAGINVYELVRNYLDTMASKAQYDAMNLAKQSGKHPTVVREIVGETCEWCDSKAGTFINPDPEVFQRHRGCDCRIITSGYRSRNGLLKNYVKDN